MSDVRGDSALEALRGAAHLRGSEVIKRLRELVECESPSGDVELLGVLRDRLRMCWESLGLRVSLIAGETGDHLVAVFDAPRGAPEGHILFLTHYDTVWSSGELCRQPFTVQGDQVTGPGVFDMKGGIVALEIALSLMKERRLTPAREIRLVCIADEEVSSVDGRRVVEQESLGAVAAFGLEPPHPDGGFKNARRGVARIMLEVAGREAHSGLDAKNGVSAVDELVDLLLDLRQILPNNDDAACNVGRIDGGTRANVVAGQARAEIGLRFATKSTEDALFHAVHSLKPHREGARLEVKVVSHRPAWDSRESVWLSEHVLDCSSALGEAVTAYPAGGAGDTNFTGSAGIATLDGLGPRGGHAHAVGEFVELSSILRRAELLATLMSQPLPTLQRS